MKRAGDGIEIYCERHAVRGDSESKCRNDVICFFRCVLCVVLSVLNGTHSSGSVEYKRLANRHKVKNIAANGIVVLKYRCEEIRSSRMSAVIRKQVTEDLQKHGTWRHFWILHSFSSVVKRRT